MKSKLTLGVIGIALMIDLVPNIVSAQARDYGTSRQLRNCPSRTAPTSGRISVEQAKEYVGCSYEEKVPFNGAVKFVDVLSLEVASKPRQARSADTRLSNLDIRKPIYDLRGSIVIHNCYNITGKSDMTTRGQNCSVYRNTKAVGKCYQTPFSEWHCVMILGNNAIESAERKMPPPE
jgi:hypothetical protein